MEATRRQRHRGGRRRLTEDAYALRGTVDVEERPQLEALVDVHHDRRWSSVLADLHLAIWCDAEHDLVAAVWCGRHILADHPVLGSVEQHVRVIRQIARLQRCRVARCQTQRHGTHVHVFGAQNLHNDLLTDPDGTRCKHVALAELGISASGNKAVGRQHDVATLGAVERNGN